MNERTHLDLFSGIGGFALAARWAGYRTIAFCERDEFCQRVLAKQFGAVADYAAGSGREAFGERESGSRKGSAMRGSAVIHPDIHDLDGKRYAGVTLLTGGFPCQPFSVAGKRQGKEDDRHLWPEMVRVIEECRPRFILGENVAGIISMELDTVLSDLERIGYACGTLVIPACAVDAPHRRDRVWILATRRGYVSDTESDSTASDAGSSRGISDDGKASDEERRRRVPSDSGGESAGAEPVAHTGHEQPQGWHEVEGREETGKIGGDQVGQEPASCGGGQDGVVAHGTGNGLEGQRQERHATGSTGLRSGAGRDQEQAVPDTGPGRREGPRTSQCGPEKPSGRIAQPSVCGISDGLPEGLHRCLWPDEDPSVPRIATGIPDRVNRLKVLGNAIVPQVAYRIIRLMK